MVTRVDMMCLYVASCVVLLHAMVLTRTAGEPLELGVRQTRQGQEHAKQILEGGNMGVLCNSSGHPGKKIYWEKADSAFRLDGHELLIRNVTRDNDGLYICHATDGTTSESIEYVNIDVLYSAKILSGISPHDKLYPNDTYYVTVDIEGNPTPTNLMVSQTSGQVIFRETSDGLLNITMVSVQCSDTGIYQLHSVNAFDSDSLTKNLTVFCAPFVNPEVRTEFNIKPRVGQVAKLVMHAAGYPQPNYTWWHKDILLNQTTDGYTSTVTIGHVAVHNYGAYLLEMANSIGKQTYSFHVIPTGPPDPPMNLTLLTHTSDSARLRWIAGYDYNDTQTFVIWKWEHGTYTELHTFLDSPIDDGREEVIRTIYHLKSSHDYNITVTTRNTNGESVRSGESVSFHTQETPTSMIRDTMFAISAFVVLLFVIGSICCFLRYRSQNRYDRTEGLHEMSSDGSDSGDDDETIALLQEIVQLKEQKLKLKKENLRQRLQKVSKEFDDLLDNIRNGVEVTKCDEVDGRIANSSIVYRDYGSTRE